VICEEFEDDSFVFDIGGTVKVDDVWFEFVLDDGLSISCRSLHWDKFLSSVERHLTKEYAQKKYGGKFYKIHGFLHTLCLSEEQAQMLVKAVNAKKDYFNSIAELSWKLVDKRN